MTTLAEIEVAAVGSRVCAVDFKVTVTRPDGSTDTQTSCSLGLARDLAKEARLVWVLSRPSITPEFFDPATGDSLTRAEGLARLGLVDATMEARARHPTASDPSTG